ncbi:hypothetical protein [Rubritalea tangerina]
MQPCWDYWWKRRVLNHGKDGAKADEVAEQRANFIEFCKSIEWK